MSGMLETSRLVQPTMRVNVTFRCTEAVKRRMDAAAAKKGLSVNEWARRCLEAKANE